MKSLSFNFLLIVLFISCSNKENSKENENIPLFNNISFVVVDGEQVEQTITFLVTNKYQSYFQSSVQVPLYKCIQSSGYTLYIGLPYNASIPELIGMRPDVQGSQLNFESDSSTYFYRSWQANNVSLSEYAVKHNTNLLYLLSETPDAEVADTLFSYEKLSQRFVYEKK